MSADLPAGIYLLDVREDDEWAAGHAPEAVHVRLSELSARTGEIPRDREVFVICRSGARSAYAAQALAGAGPPMSAGARPAPFGGDPPPRRYARPLGHYTELGEKRDGPEGRGARA